MEVMYSVNCEISANKICNICNIFSRAITFRFFSIVLFDYYLDYISMIDLSYVRH